jgi:hypothetical protein
MLWCGHGRRVDILGLAVCGLTPETARQGGFEPLDHSAPAHDPTFERLIDEGTEEVVDGIARVRWRLADRAIADIRADLTDRVVKTATPLLDSADAASIRPLRAVAAGTATEADTARLAELEARAKVIRDRQAVLLTTIADADVATLRALDLTAGWP